MMSEWLKIMLEEIARKRTEAEEARIEAERRGADDPATRRPDGDRAAG